MQLLGQHGSLADAQIAAHLGVPSDDVRVVLADLRYRGLVDVFGLGQLEGNLTRAAAYWRLTEEGRAEVERLRVRNDASSPRSLLQDLLRRSLKRDAAASSTAGVLQQSDRGTLRPRRTGGRRARLVRRRRDRHDVKDESPGGNTGLSTDARSRALHRRDAGRKHQTPGRRPRGPEPAPNKPACLRDGSVLVRGCRVLVECDGRLASAASRCQRLRRPFPPDRTARMA